MNKAKKKYKAKVVRKYIEIYPSELELIAIIEKLKANGVAFSTYVKELIVRGDRDGRDRDF